MKLAIIVILMLALSVPAVLAQPIFDYVNAPDPAYTWESTGETSTISGARIFDMTMTSQVWQSITWNHRVHIIIPSNLKSPETAFLYITGGGMSAAERNQLEAIAAMISAPVVFLGDIPNQPLFGGKVEDEIIALTFRKTLETGDKTWPLLYPMTKAAIRAMDTVQQWSRETPDIHPIKSFYVSGASKRGWTTWFTAEVEPERVIAAAPMVYDNLNLPAQMAAHKEAWGDYSEQINDYTDLNLPGLLQSPEGKAFAAIVDPYTYIDCATMPKLIISGTNDRYWPLDAAKHYFDDLTGPKYMLYVPNSGHGLNDYTRVLMAQAGFFAAAAGRASFPDLHWQFIDGRHLKLVVNPGDQPTDVTLTLPRKRNTVMDLSNGIRQQLMTSDAK